MPNVELREKLVEQFHELSNKTDWEELDNCNINNDKKADPKALSMRAWRRPAVNGTSMCLKIKTVFPKADLGAFWKALTDYEERFKWDNRIVNGEIIEKNEQDKCVIVYQETPKSPIPIVSVREVLFKSF
jgi:hypothetical protein